MGRLMWNENCDGCHIDGLLSFLFFRFGTLYNMPRFIDRTIPLRKWIYLAHSPLDLCFPLCAVLTVQTHTHTKLTSHEYRRLQYGGQRIGISNQQSIYSYPSAHTIGFDIGLSDANTENWKKKSRKNYTPMHRAQNPCSMLDLSVCSSNQYAHNPFAVDSNWIRRRWLWHMLWAQVWFLVCHSIGFALSLTISSISRKMLICCNAHDGWWWAMAGWYRGE